MPNTNFRYIGFVSCVFQHTDDIVKDLDLSNCIMFKLGDSEIKPSSTLKDVSSKSFFIL